MGSSGYQPQREVTGRDSCDPSFLPAGAPIADSGRPIARITKRPGHPAVEARVARRCPIEAATQSRSTERALDQGDRNVRRLIMLFVLLGLLVPAGIVTAEEEGTGQDTEVKDDTNAQAEDEKDEGLDLEKLTLERLFPEKSFFGPSARGTSFSDNGRYAAYLYRPYKERRHGNDLWIYDFETGQTRRITMVSVMSEFQEATRKVREDRIKKAKKAGLGKKKAKKDGAEKEETGGGDQTDEAVVDDGLSGEWEGRATGGEKIELPPDGITFTLSIELGDDNAVIGTLTTDMASATITSGTYDPDTGALECTFTDPESGMTATLNATVADGEMKGKLTIDMLNVTLDVTAKRTSKVVGGAAFMDDEEEDEVDVEDQGDESDDEHTGDGDDENGEGDDEEIDLGDLVTDKDADDDKAPRYGGVQTYTWAPEATELMFLSGGDLYRYDVEAHEITRLTRTKEPEFDVQYLPDGSGYTYRRGGGLIRITFGSSLIEQIDPDLPGGESMSGYKISPDGTHLAFVTTKGGSFWNAGHTVNIVNYRSRFAQVRQVRRHMPDDPFPKVQWAVYVYNLDGHMTERGKLSRIHEFEQTGPRDVVMVPEWSPDSSRATFATFKQANDQVEILEARLPAPDEEDEATAEETDAQNGSESAESPQDENGEKAEDDNEEPKEKKPVDKARVVYRFLHYGGPNTPRMMQPYYLADSNRIAFVCEISGFRHVHVLDPLYQQLDQITRGKYEVYPLDISDDHRWMFATATKEDPAQLDIYRIDLVEGKMERISKLDGYHSSVAVSDDGTRAMANFVDYGRLNELTAIEIDEDEPKVLTDSHPKEAKELTEPVPEFFTYQNRHGHEIHGFMFKPLDWTDQDKRPLLIYVYGGPLGTRKMVNRGSYSSDAYFFAYYMAYKHGYITCTIDPRGASGYGGLFEKSNFEQVGKPQVEDIVDGVKWFIENQGVDPERVGIHGWSFGGFQTQMCLYTEPDVFACGIAGAGPTEWYNYNSWYTTGTVGEKEHLDGKNNSDKYTLLPLAKNLKAKLLLVHGMEDSNVLYQDTVRMYRELLKAGKEALVELFLDPTGGHGLGGDVKRINRMRKYEEFLLRCLGEGKPAGAEAEEDEAETTDDKATEEAKRRVRVIF
jgi:dipeptidyl-peptidase-4